MGKEIFTPESKSIKSIFGDAESFYKMPEYQRPYSWDDERVEQLWEDIYSSYKNYHETKDTNDVIDETYFLGSIILIQNKDSYDVVDGQQRLTTLYILFCVLRDEYPDFNVNASSRDEVTIDKIKDYIKQQDKFERLILKTQVEHHNTFEHDIVNKINWPAKFTKEEKSKNKYMNTALIFRRLLAGLESDQERIELINYLFNRVQLIKITCSSQSFAIKLFQVLNARGMDLAPADLIKSFLYGQISDESHKETFIQEWRTIENTLKNSGSTITDLFNTYLYYKLATNPKKTLYEELVPIFKGGNSNEIIHKFKKFVEEFLLINRSKVYDIYMLKYLRHQIYWKAIITTAKYLKLTFLNKFISELTKFYYLYWIGGYTSAKIKQTSFNLIKWLKGIIDLDSYDNNKEYERFCYQRNDLNLIETLSEIKGNQKRITIDLENSGQSQLHFDLIRFKLEEKLKNDNAKERAIKNLKENVYSEAWLKPLLIWIEYSLCEDRDFIDRDKNIHTEHIMPKSRNFNYWKETFEEEQYNEHLNKIENLTLLSGYRNIEANDRPFYAKSKLNKPEELTKLWNENLKEYLDKKFIYRGKGIDGSTKYEITKHIYEEYDEWNLKNMYLRKKWIYERIAKILGITSE